MKVISKTTFNKISLISPDELVAQGIITPSRVSGYDCPLCGSGTGKNGTGMTYNKSIEDHTSFTCHAGNHSFNVFTLCAMHYALDTKKDFIKLCEKICADFGIPIEYEEKDFPKGSRKRNKKKNAGKPIDEITLGFIKGDLATSIEPLKKYIDAVKTWRGLTFETLSKFNCRIIWEWTPPVSRTKPYTPTPRMIIKCSDEGYLARMMSAPEALYDPKKREFFKGKEKMHAGRKTLFNPEALDSSEIFCVEGYIDAMSIAQIGFPCVALGGVGEYDLLVDAVSKMKKKPKIIVLFDNDTAGREYAPLLSEGLIGENCPAVIRYLSSGEEKIDANDILAKQGDDALRGKLQEIYRDSIAELSAISDEMERKSQARLDDADLNSLFKGNDSDLTFAKRLEILCGSLIRWIQDSEQWLFWQDGVWCRGSEKNSCVAHFGRSLADTLSEYATTNAEKDLAEKFQSANKINSAITLLRTCEKIRISEEDLDNHLNLLNCQNGVVDLTDGNFYPHEDSIRKKLITQQCRAPYFPHVESELVTNFFESTFPNEDDRAGFLRWLGYCLTGETSEEKFMIWQGEGGNGKGVASKTILHLLGNYGVGLPSTALLRNRKNFDPNTATTSLNALEKARFAISEELPLDSELDSALIKNLTGGDAINLRRNYGEYRLIQSTAKINLSGNFLPRLENSEDLGLIRRMLNMHFAVKFYGSEKLKPDPNLKKKMLLPENLKALLSLIVGESMNWYRVGLIISDGMKKETQKHLSQNDFITDFIDDNFIRKANATVKAKDFISKLKAEYPRECGRYKRADLIQRIKNIDGISYETDRHNCRVFKGIGEVEDNFSGEKISDSDIPPFDENDLPL